MALDLGELVVRLRVDDSQYVSGLKAAPATAHRAGQQIGDSINRGADGRLRDARGRFVAAGTGIGQSVGQGAERGMMPSLGRIGGLIAALGLGKLAIDAGKFGLQVYSSNEKARISFTTMLGSAHEADSFLAQMRDFARDTPFEFPELQSAASKLVSVGINADKVIPIMTTLGNSTAGMGTGAEGVNRATVALQQMAMKGKISAEEMMQLSEAGVDGWGALAAATGLSTAELMKLASQGKLGKDSINDLMGALESGKGFEKFNGMMEAQALSLDGMLSNLKDTLGTELAAAIDESGLDDDLKGGIEAVTAALPTLIGHVKDFATGLRDAASWVRDNASWLGPLAAALGGAAAGIMIVVGAMRAWAVVQLVLNSALLANPIGLVVVAIAALVAGLIYAYNTSEDFRNIVNGAFTAIGEMGRWLWNKALAPAFRAIVNGFAWVVDGLANMLDALGNVPGFEWAKEAAGKLRGMAEQARNAAKGIKDIPASKSVKISITVGGADKLDAAARNFRALGIMGARARGGPVTAGGLYLVGEEGPELVRFENSGTVYTAGQTRQMLSSGSNTGLGAASGASGQGGGLDVGAIREGVAAAIAGAELRITGANVLSDAMSGRILLAAQRA